MSDAPRPIEVRRQRAETVRNLRSEIARGLVRCAAEGQGELVNLRLDPQNADCDIVRRMLQGLVLVEGFAPRDLRRGLVILSDERVTAWCWRCIDSAELLQ